MTDSQYFQPAPQWTVSVAGPDDVHQFNTELDALRFANQINRTYLADLLAHPGNEVLCLATVSDASPPLVAISTEPQSAEFCWLVELFLGDGTGNSLGWYHTGFTDIGGGSRSTQDPLKAKRYSTWREANIASCKLGHTLQGTWRAVQHGFIAPEIQAPEGGPQPDWYAVTSLRAPCIDKAIRRLDVAEEYADKQRDLWPDVKVVPLYRAATAPIALDDEDRTRALNLAYQFRSHPASRGIDDIERAGEVILSLLAATAKPSPAEGDRQWNVPGSAHPERLFAEWLNDQRMKSVSEVFHDIVRRYREALDSPVQPKGTEPDDDPWTETQVADICGAIKDHCGPATAARLRRMIQGAQAPAPVPALTEMQIDKLLNDLDNVALNFGDDLPGLALNSRGLERSRDVVRAAFASPAVKAEEPVLWRYRRWVIADQCSTPWYEMKKNPLEADLPNLDVAPLIEVVPLYAGDPTLKVDGAASYPPVHPMGGGNAG